MKYLLILVLLLKIVVVSGQHNQVYVEDGRLYHKNGEELSLWGVNLQPNLSWEYNSLMKPLGISWDAEKWKEYTDEAIDELLLMNCEVIRCHLTPADFTDDKGNLVETIYLDLLDYMVARAAENDIYVSLSFINHMGNWAVKNSFMNQNDRKRWITDTSIVNASQNYIEQLLNRENSYSNNVYLSDTVFTMFEIINEPDYESFSVNRKSNVLEYINGMYDLIRSTGAEQPIGWCCNWHRMINGNEDVFEAISESKIEVVSFCNYPGQDLVGQNYWNNPVDLSKENYANWFKNCYQKYDWYGWILGDAFKDKAKVVYEFETFFNQSASLYPAQASLFRSLGVQQATMWHYSMPVYAQYIGGSHFLNLRSTPRKAASFIVAGEIFSDIPLYSAYDTKSTIDIVTDRYMFSHSKDLCIYSSEDKYYYSNNVSENELPKPPSNPKYIIGYGNSPLVSYSGNGLYHVDLVDGQKVIILQPDYEWIREPWRNSDYKMVTKLTDPDSQSFKLTLDKKTGVKDLQGNSFKTLSINYNRKTASLKIESDEALKQVIIFNTNGKIEYRNERIDETCLEINQSFDSGIYIIKIGNKKTYKYRIIN